MTGSAARAPRLVVGFDRGSASAGEIVRSLPRDAAVDFVLADTGYARTAAAVLGCAGAVHPLNESTMRLLVERGAEGVVTFSEGMLRPCADIAERLNVPFHSPHTVCALTDKAQQRSRLAAAGCDATMSRCCDRAQLPDAVRAVGTPCVVKPARGHGSVETFLLTDPATAHRLAESVPDREWVVEEYLVGADQRRGARDLGPDRRFGDYVSVESLCSPAGIRHVGVTGKYPFVAPFREVGQFWPAALDADIEGAVRDLVTAALRALGVRTGFTHTEVKLTPSGPRIIEVNGRLGGHLPDLYRRAAGLDLIAMAIESALGRPPDVEPVWRPGVTFQYNAPAPTEPATYRGTRGMSDARGLPSVESYRVYPRPGDLLPGGRGTQPLDLLCGWAPDHRAVFNALDVALAGLTHEFLDGAQTPFTTTPDRPWRSGSARHPS